MAGRRIRADDEHCFLSAGVGCAQGRSHCVQAASIEHSFVDGITPVTADSDHHFLRALAGCFGIGHGQLNLQLRVLAVRG